MKKIKLLKTIGCIALVATPVIVAPIIMSTSCATTDPVDPGIKVTSIQGINLKQDGVTINPDNISAVAKYKTYQVYNAQSTAEMELSIGIYFYINDDLTPVKYTEIKDQISLDLICKANGGPVDSIFEIQDDDTISIVNQKATDSVNSTESNKFCSFDSTGTTQPHGRFVINNTSKAIVSYGIKDATDSVTISFIE